MIDHKNTFVRKEYNPDGQISFMHTFFEKVKGVRIYHGRAVGWYNYGEFKYYAYWYLDKREGEHFNYL